MPELSKNFQDLKTEVETTKKSQRETTLEIENLGKKFRRIQKPIRRKHKNHLKKYRRTWVNRQK